MAKGNVCKPVKEQDVPQTSDAIAPPPGLSLPPGLPAPPTQKAISGICPPPGLAPPPGLSMLQGKSGTPDCCTAAAKVEIPVSAPRYIPNPLRAERLDFFAIAPKRDAAGTHQVQITGLPNTMLSDVMLEAMLSQAKLDGHYASFTTTPGTVCGDALVTLHGLHAARQCINHFQGRPWGLSGNPVRAWLVESRAEKSQPQVVGLNAWRMPFQSSQFQKDHGTHCTMISFAEIAKSTAGLSADAPVFVPGSSFTMSAMTPEFVPGCTAHESEALERKFGNTSDESTADAESDVGSSNDGGAHEVS